MNYDLRMGYNSPYQQNTVGTIKNDFKEANFYNACVFF